MSMGAITNYSKRALHSSHNDKSVFTVNINPQSTGLLKLMRQLLNRQSDCRLGVISAEACCLKATLCNGSFKPRAMQ